MDEPSPTVWVLNREGAPLPCAIYLTKEKALDFIERHSFTGTLSEFPLDESTYDHALRSQLFRPKNEKERSAWFICDFSPRLPHEHFQDGKMN